ncbi:MAG: glutamate racemase [Oceanospirillaceae bacterium]|nr:glutamate racemase [Oceanospirillaceae bacterium]
MHSNHPIGIFDSGVGGLSVAAHIHRELPFESLIYVADSGFAPYGDKSTQFIEQRCQEICQFLVQQQVKAIVVACNTATVSCITELRARFKLPIIGMEPGIKPALQLTKTGIIGVLATEQTVRSGAVNRLIFRFSDSSKVLVQGCPGLVELVEQANCDSPSLMTLLEGYLQPLLIKGVDTIVIGCTHYAFLISMIQDIVGQHIHIVTSHEAVTAELQRRLVANQLLTPEQQITEPLFYSTDKSVKSAATISQLWNKPINLATF